MIMLKPWKSMNLSVFAISLFFSSVLVFSGVCVSHAEAYMFSFSEEKVLGRALSEDYLMSVKTVRDDLGVKNMQNVIINANASVFRNRGDGRTLEWIRVVDEGNNSISASTLAGGYIYITEDTLKFINTIPDKGYIEGQLRPNVMHNVYNDSMLSFVIAHEMSHWANMDFLKHYNTVESANAMRSVLGVGKATMTREQGMQYLQNYENRQDIRNFSIQVEDQADIDGIKYANKNGMYSGTGGALMYLHRTAKLEGITGSGGVSYNPHSATGKRLNRVYAYLRSSSNNRVSIDNMGRLTVDGKLLNGNGKAPADRREVTAQERTFYVAGQIASAIQKGLFSSGNLKALNAGSVYLPANIYIQGQSALVISDANGNGVIVEKFFFGEDRLNAILHGAVPQTAEEVYAKNLISLIP